MSFNNVVHYYMWSSEGSSPVCISIEQPLQDRYTGSPSRSVLVYTSCHVIRSLSRDPLDYVRLTINIKLDYGISARGEIGTL